MEKQDFFSDARDDLTGPLAGVRVLEITTTWAGPMCAAVRADFGADVVKVEIPSGDVGRAISPMLPGTEVSFMHATVNRNKRSFSLDIRAAEGRDLVLQLAAEADVLVENFKVGTMEGYGLGYAQVKTHKPDIVYVSITGWGQFGPNHLAAGYDPLASSLRIFVCEWLARWRSHKGRDLPGGRSWRFTCRAWCSGGAAPSRPDGRRTAC